MKMSEISSMQISQILILSVTGVVVGNLLSYGLSLGLPAAMPFYLKTSDVCLVSVAFIGIALLFGLISLLQVAKIDPISIIGGGDE
jgi:putative ABC transport system permease protein